MPSQFHITPQNKACFLSVTMQKPLSQQTFPGEFVSSVSDFLIKTCSNEIFSIMAYVDTRSHYPLDFDVSSFSEFAPKEAKFILLKPQDAIPLLEEAISSVQLVLQEKHIEIKQKVLVVKEYVHPRLFNLPKNLLFTKPNISSLRSKDVHKLIEFSATVVRVGPVLMQETEKLFQCRKCAHRFTVLADITQRGLFDMPLKCPSSSDADSRKQCSSTNFAPVENIPLCRDYQEIKIQEKTQNIDVGSIPRSILVALTDDLVDSCKPGDDVILSGVMLRRWNRNFVNDQRCDVELMVKATKIQFANQQKAFLNINDEQKKEFIDFWKEFQSCPLRGRDFILKSFCPQIYGLRMVKLIVMMSFIGGVPRKDASGSRVRGESHLLIVGDPGTAKSQILKYAVKLSPRGVLTTGIGTTSAGLTVSAAKDPSTGQWMLDAGALVLADGGLCCIDEFDGIRESDRGAIHEAMEQQTLSVAKAGLVCTLDTRTTVFAALNPKGGRASNNALDAAGSIHVPLTIPIASPLLSRFDVVLSMMDERNEEWDKELSSTLLSRFCKKNGSTNDSSMDGSSQLWSLEKMRIYLYHVRSQLHPVLSKDAELLLSTYYTKERLILTGLAGRTTVRLLESLIRLTQAHARLMFKSKATVQDAVLAIIAVESSAFSQNLFGELSNIYASFPEDPEMEYKNQCEQILLKLGLEGKLSLDESFPSSISSPSPEKPVGVEGRVEKFVEMKVPGREKVKVTPEIDGISIAKIADTDRICHDDLNVKYNVSPDESFSEQVDESRLKKHNIMKHGREQTKEVGTVMKQAASRVQKNDSECNHAKFFQKEKDPFEDRNFTESKHSHVDTELDSLAGKGGQDDGSIRNSKDRKLSFSDTCSGNSRGEGAQNDCSILKKAKDLNAKKDQESLNSDGCTGLQDRGTQDDRITFKKGKEQNSIDDKDSDGGNEFGSLKSNEARQDRDRSYQKKLDGQKLLDSFVRKTNESCGRAPQQILSVKLIDDSDRKNKRALETGDDDDNGLGESLGQPRSQVLGPSEKRKRNENPDPNAYFSLDMENDDFDPWS